jgi:hypothetical protein
MEFAYRWPHTGQQFDGLFEIAVVGGVGIEVQIVQRRR